MDFENQNEGYVLIQNKNKAKNKLKTGILHQVWRKRKRKATRSLAFYI